MIVFYIIAAFAFVAWWLIGKSNGLAGYDNDGDST